MNHQNTTNLFIMGFGRVGQTLVRQILAAQERHRRPIPDLNVVGLADSRALLYRPEGLTIAQIQTALEHKGKGRSLAELDPAHPLTSLDSLLKPGDILVDTSASPHTLSYLLHAVQKAVGVVLANKIPLCGPWDQAQKLFTHPYLKYEATVGAGLPVINTLQYLMETGDRFHAITACLSGTLGYLCSRLEEGAPYSQIIRDAMGLGYTEPDPRQDLGGMDVARKAVILSRTAGFPIELSDISIAPLYPTELDPHPVDEFLQLLERVNDEYSDLVGQAVAQRKVPRYTAHITAEGVQVGLTFPGKATPLGSLKGPENYMAFQTNRYADSPLVISGPGAGLEVTAAGVFGDIIRLARELKR